MRAAMYVYWQTPGGQALDGVPSARVAMACGAGIYISGRTVAFKVYHLDSMGVRGYPWHLGERVVMGTSHPVEHYDRIDSFSSMREAIAEARRRVRYCDGADRAVA